MKKTLLLAGITGLFASMAHAQSNVTLYGLLDAGVTYTSNDQKQSGANFRATGNQTSGSRFGLAGAEDLGGGLKAIFTLESGFDVFDGTADNDRLFNRQSWVGLSSPTWGAVTIGRQYDSVVDYLSPLSLANIDEKGGGRMFSHPFNNDNLNASFRINNSFKYASPNWGGFSFGALYGASNDENGMSSNNRAYSIGAKYENGPLRLAASYLALNEPNGAGNSGGAVSNDYAFQADKQQTFGVGGSYAFGPATLGFVYTQTTLDSVQNFGAGSGLSTVGSSDMKINNYELNGKYSVTPAWLLSAAYTFTDAKYRTTTGDQKGNWNQFTIMSDYSLSKRTDVYLAAAYQTAGGDADRAFIAGGSGYSDSDSQVVVTTGMRHRF
ncbi:porin [Pararobbsia alpina]|uniref:Outer membrane porin protein n=1 Tax=Pararobbsia alpina TaxID=621374 RepID=A0A6S7ASM7_9BURK|nr:porin [Pararobbsia alpina]CAB3775763.1 Outer membrane porin protein [Pararobbsia alpina]